MTQNFSDQIAFFQLAGDNRSAFRSIAKTIRRVGPAALARFYARVRQTPAAARYFPSEQILEHAKDKQLQHWLSLFSGSLDAAYIERARTIGVVHARIGLEPSLYFGAYAQVLGELIDVMTRRTWYGWLPGVRSNARRNATLVRAALFDMDIAMTTVFDSALGQVSEAANSVRTGAGEIASASDDLARRTEQQAVALNQTAASVARVNETVTQTAASAAEMAHAVERARKDAVEGDTVVTAAVAAMGDIETSSQQISQIVSLIDSIAFQTNLLALNAGVEAARAGDSGKGFAVVANEVRALAQRSADAAREIKDLITASSGHVESGAGLVRKTGAALQSIVDQIGTIAGYVHEVGDATKVQAISVNEINAAVNEIEEMTQHNAAMVEQSNAASRSLSTEAETMVELVQRFNKDKDGPPQASRPQRGGRPQLARVA